MSPDSNVCVIVAARNATATLERCLASALRQDEVQEVVIVDDASTDNTAMVAAAADDGSGRLHIIRLTENRGPAAARNLARSELFCVLDADDWIQDGRIGRMLAAADGSDWDLLADDLLLAMESSPGLPCDRMLGLRDGVLREIDLIEFIAGNIADRRRQRRELGYLKPLMRRSFLDRAGLNYDENLRLGEDYVLYAEALLRGARFVLISACGYVAVERSGSLSRAHGVADLEQLLAADRRLIAEATSARPDAVSVLEAHSRHVLLKLQYRRVLDAKRRGHCVEAARHLFSSPFTTAYVIAQTLRARLGAGSG